MDVGASMTLHDANGGTSTLKGIMPNLEPKIGGLITTSNYWVTTTCLLDICTIRTTMATTEFSVYQ